jgi:hypothetical protein
MANLCGDCRYFKASTHSDAFIQSGIMECQKEPPKQAPNKQHGESRFPVVTADQEACGGFLVDPPTEV